MKTALALLLTFVCCCVQAEVYKWTNAHGVVHYGDRPPEQNDSAAATVTTVELSPIHIANDGKVSNPEQTPAPNMEQIKSTPLNTDNAVAQGQNALALVAQWQQYVRMQINNIIEQINIWRGVSSSNPVITNDNINQASTTAVPPTNKVEIYTAAWCGACKKAKQWLNEKNISYQEYDVEKDSNAALRMQHLGGGGGIPFAVINGKTIEGFSPYRYSSALH